MKPTFLAILLPALMAAPLATQDEAKPKSDQAKAKKAAEPLEIGGTIAADVSLQDIDGKAFKFGDARGKPIVLHFWSITCPYEEAAEPKLMALAKELGDKAIVLAVNANAGEIGAKPAAEAFESKDRKAETYKKIRKHVKSVDFNHRVLVDHSGKFARHLDGKTTPHLFVFDKEGVLRYQGALDDDPRGNKGDETKQYARDAVMALLAGEKVAVETTRPYG
ncbi:MAG: redoxin domain-containing protein [Planctomycetota bacterium]|jgi:thiol-disulfide isomerase/thioredoxin